MSPAFLDLAGDEGIGNAGTGHANDVQLPGAHRVHHDVRVREPADTDDRFLRVGPEFLDPRTLPVLGVEPGGAGVVVKGVNLNVPQVHEMVGEFYKPDALLVDPDRVLASDRARVNAEPSCHGGRVADSVADPLQRFPPESSPVLE